MNELTTFKRVARQIVENLASGRSVEIKASKKVAEEFAEALHLVEREHARIVKARVNAGRPRLTGPDIKKNTLYQRERRALMKLQQQQKEQQ